MLLSALWKKGRVKMRERKSYVSLDEIGIDGASLSIRHQDLSREGRRTGAILIISMTSHPKVV